MRSLNRAIWTSGLPVSVGCVPYWSMRDFFCSLASTNLMHSFYIFNLLWYASRLTCCRWGCKGSRIKGKGSANKPAPKHDSGDFRELVTGFARDISQAKQRHLRPGSICGLGTRGYSQLSSSIQKFPNLQDSRCYVGEASPMAGQRRTGGSVA